MKKVRVISYIVSFMMIVSLIFIPSIRANAANVSLGVSASTINIGDSVTVTVSVPDGITATIDLTYSSDVVSFSGASAEVGANGSNVRINAGKYSSAGSNSVSVTFRANTSGTASFSAGVASAVDDNTVEDVVLGGASTSITVANQAAAQPSTPPAGGQDTPAEAPKSGDNSLASLQISSGTLSPGFKQNVTNYTATVGYNVSNIVVSATPSHGNAVIESVTGNGNVNLEVGDNTIQVVVKAENGVKATYKIVVTRLAEGDTVQETESESETETQTQSTEDILQWNGQKLEPAENVPDEVIPSDFTETTVMINSVETPCLTFANGNLKVLYLQNEEGTKGLYVYDEVQQVVYPFVKIGSESTYVIVLLPDEANAPAPENYKACTLSIEGQGIINAYQFVEPVAETETTSWFGAETFYAAEPVAADFYLIYCMNQSGETGWYVYDSVEGTTQRYLGTVHTSATDGSGAVANPENTQDYNKLLAELEAAKNLQLIIICVAVFIVVVLVVIIINLILRRRSDEILDEDYEDEDYEDEDYDDEDFDADECDEDELDEDELDEDKLDEDEDAAEKIEAVAAGDDVLEDEDEIEIEFYEMPQVDTTTETDVESDLEDDDEVEIEFYEMTEEETTDDDEVEVEFFDMEALLMKEAIAPEQKTSKTKKKAEIPVSVEDIYMDDDEDDDDLEFIELD